MAERRTPGESTPSPRAAGPDGGRPRPRSGADGGLRGLVGAGPSRVGPVAAMRARDVARPSRSDLDLAEATVTIRRRPGLEPAPAAPLPGRGKRRPKGHRGPVEPS